MTLGSEDFRALNVYKKQYFTDLKCTKINDLKRCNLSIFDDFYSTIIIASRSLGKEWADADDFWEKRCRKQKSTTIQGLLFN
jgi:hypothetical protein